VEAHFQYVQCSSHARLVGWQGQPYNNLWGPGKMIELPTSIFHLALSSSTSFKSMTRTYNLFISHSWTYPSQYDGLVNLLRKDPYFDFHNYSVPKDDPIHDASNDRQLREAIRRKMQPCSAILILAGIYATYSKWINEEIYLAKWGFNMPKPIVAVEYWGSERTSVPVKNAAQAVVKWNSQSIINAIKEVTR